MATASMFKFGTDLNQYITQSDVTCLNEADTNKCDNLFMGDTTNVLKSDADEQLLISVPFRQSVRLEGLSITAPANDSAPLTVKLFINNDSMDFSDAEDGKAQQELELTPEELTPEGLTKLNFVKFQYVDHITLFVADNNGDEVTTMSGLHFFGTTIDGTDVSAIKKC